MERLRNLLIEILRYIVFILWLVVRIPLLCLYYIGEFIEKIFKKNKEVEK